jgi:hypothetical protein
VRTNCMRREDRRMGYTRDEWQGVGLCRGQLSRQKVARVSVGGCREWGFGGLIDRGY